MTADIISLFSSRDKLELNDNKDVIPCGIDFVGITTVGCSTRVCACSAANIILLLFGRIIIFSAFNSLMAFTISSVLGFIVCPPLITTSTPRLLKISIIPSPIATATMPYGCGG